MTGSDFSGGGPKSMTGPWVAIIGATGSGKSALAMRLARFLKQNLIDSEIVNCDSVQVYRGFDIGSAKPSKDEQQQIKHHLIDLVEWDQGYDAAQFARDARGVMTQLWQGGVIPLVVGGTGLYLRSLVGEMWDDDLPKDENLRNVLRGETQDALVQKLWQVDPLRAKKIHPHDRFRLIRAIEIATLRSGQPKDQSVMPSKNLLNERWQPTFTIHLDPPRTQLHQSIAHRTQAMLDSGLVDEVRAMLSRGVSPQCKPMGSIGYKETVASLQGESPWESLADRIAASTRQYAKRQCTWFRRSNTDRNIGGELAAEVFNEVLAKINH